MRRFQWDQSTPGIALRLGPEAAEMCASLAR
jgi:hypothetical protein